MRLFPRFGPRLPRLHRPAGPRPVVISTVVLNWNRSGLLARMLESYLDTVRVPHELIVADNGSTDDSRDVIRGFTDRYRNVSAVLLDRNQGGEAFNAGLEHASGCLLHLSANDIEYLPGWSESVLEKFDAFPDLGQLSVYGPVPSDAEAWEVKLCTLRHSQGRIIYNTEHNVGASSILVRQLWDEGLRIHNLPSTTGGFLFPDDGKLSAEIRRSGRTIAWSDRYLVRNLGHSVAEMEANPEYYRENYRTKPQGLERLAERMERWKAQPKPVRESFLLPGEILCPEKTFAHPACANPQLWSMLDSNTAEVECLEFLYGLVRVLKPELAVETGAWHGHLSLAIARALLQNGFGRLIAFESDAESWRVAGRRLNEAQVDHLAEVRNESSLKADAPDAIGLLVLDSSPSVFGREFERLRPRLSPGALVAVQGIHDAPAALRALAAIKIASPRGLAVFQMPPC